MPPLCPPLLPARQVSHLPIRNAQYNCSHAGISNSVIQSVNQPGLLRKKEKKRKLMSASSCVLHQKEASQDLISASSHTQPPHQILQIVRVYLQTQRERERDNRCFLLAWEYSYYQNIFQLPKDAGIRYLIGPSSTEYLSVESKAQLSSAPSRWISSHTLHLPRR